MRKVIQLFIEWINHLVYNFGTTRVTCRHERRTMRSEKISQPALLTGSHQFYYSTPLLWCLTLTSHMPSVNPHTEKERMNERAKYIKIRLCTTDPIKQSIIHLDAIQVFDHDMIRRICATLHLSLKSASKNIVLSKKKKKIIISLFQRT